jgi:hypothetical protein
LRNGAADRRLEGCSRLIVPSLAAALIASIGSYFIDALIADFVGIEIRIFVGIIDSILIYFYARRWLVNLRDGL